MHTIDCFGIKIHTIYPHEISWTLYQGCGNSDLKSQLQLPLIESSNNIDGINLECIHNLDGCVTFSIYDNYGDGLCCAFSDNGYYDIYYHDALIYHSNGTFGEGERKIFILTDQTYSPKPTVQCLFFFFLVVCFSNVVC